MADHVALMREAAAEMRRRAEKATPGPWDTADDGLVWPERLGDPVSGSTEVEDAEHIASWHPGVALLVADWLESVAYGWLDIESRNQKKALALARAYLGWEGGA